MDIYNYDPVTREFLSQGNADPHPFKEDEWLIPANATDHAPTIEPGANEVLVINQDGDRWSRTKDYRGTTYWLQDGTKVEITELGISPPQDALYEEPDTRTLEELVSDSLELVKSNHSRVLNELCGNASIEERDTWPLQKSWATEYLASASEYDKNMLLGLLTTQEIQMLTADGQDPATHMSTHILLKSEAMDLLTSKAGGLTREADALIEAATSKEDVDTALASLSVKMGETIQVFKEATGV